MTTVSTAVVSAQAGGTPLKPSATTSTVSVVKLFDRSKITNGFVPHPDFLDGRKRCSVRYPTDKEWCQRAHQSVTVRKTVADGTRSDIPGIHRLNKELFDAIREDKNGAEFDEAEASMIIGKLEKCVVQEVKRQGVQYEITMKAFDGSIVTHTLRIPTQKQLMDFGRSAIDVIGRKQAVETRVALEPAKDLWAKVMVKCEGYKDSTGPNDTVPIPHMQIAVDELWSAINSDFEDTDPED